jgi:hypothetical protein
MYKRRTSGHNIPMWARSVPIFMYEKMEQPGRIGRRQAIHRLYGDGCQAVPLSQGREGGGEGSVLWPVALQSQVGVLAEQGGQAGRRMIRGGHVPGAQIALDPTRATATQTDQPVPVCLEHLPRDPAGRPRLATVGLGLQARREPA